MSFLFIPFFFYLTAQIVLNIRNRSYDCVCFFFTTLRITHSKRSRMQKILQVRVFVLPPIKIIKIKKKS